MSIGRTDPEILAVRAAAPDRCEIELLVPADLGYFRGHFDGFAILPGVVQLHWTLQLGRRYLGLPAGPAASLQVKFRKPIRPAARLLLTLTRRAASGGEQLAFEYGWDGAPCSSGKILLPSR